MISADDTFFIKKSQSNSDTENTIIKSKINQIDNKSNQICTLKRLEGVQVWVW